MKKQCANPGCGKQFTPKRTFDKYCSYDCAKPFLSDKPKQKPKTCAKEDCENEFIPRNLGQKHCSPKCMYADQKPKRKRIVTRTTTQVFGTSKKQSSLDAKYSRERKAFLALPENRVCKITGLPTNEVHHAKGRRGYADQWAKDNDVPLLLDKRFWKAVHHDAHEVIEKNPKWAKKHGYSYDRLETVF